MNFTSEELTLIGTLAGTFIGGLFGFLIAWISKRSEERKSFIHVALEQHRIEIDRAYKKGGGWVLPYHVYLLSTLQSAKLINAWFLTPKRMRRLLERQDKIIKTAVEYARSKRSDSSGRDNVLTKKK